MNQHLIKTPVAVETVHSYHDDDDEEDEEDWKDVNECASLVSKPDNCTNQTLPDLTSLDLPPFVATNKQVFSPNDTFPFDPVISHDQKLKLLQLARVFSQFMIDNNFADKYFIMGDSLLGSYRHHDIIPTDDDFDFPVDIQVRESIRELTQSLEPHYVYSEHYRLGLYYLKPNNRTTDFTEHHHFTSAPEADGYYWPAIDIFYYQIKQTTLHFIRGDMPMFSKDVVFPLLSSDH